MFFNFGKAINWEEKKQFVRICGALEHHSFVISLFKKCGWFNTVLHHYNDEGSYIFKIDCRIPHISLLSLLLIRVFHISVS